jgi:TRAP-type C4-dicarboxylate transport system permease large subunit
VSLDQIIGKLIPFVLVIVGCLLIITYVPMLSVGLRDLVYAR